MNDNVFIIVFFLNIYSHVHKFSTLKNFVA